jgi:hypothetical protein
MNARDVYSDHALIAGVILLFLGLGNWIVGAMESSRFEGLVQRTAQTGLEGKHTLFRQLDQQKNEEVLRRITEDREKYNAARVKLDFFYVVLGGGQLLVFLGLIVTFFALMRIIKRDGIAKVSQLATQAFREKG